VKRLLSLLEAQRGIAVVSIAVLNEIALSPPAVVEALLRQVEWIKPTVHPIREDVKALARSYIAADVLPERRVIDAIHVAAATVYQVDYLVSWNHRHKTRPKKKLEFAAVNTLNGYWKTPFICNPVEACNELRGG
jgi:hypothetical protein